MSGIRHHLLDIIEPDSNFSAGDFVNFAKVAVDDIISRKKNVIIAGGTWFYIKSFLEEDKMPNIGINKELRDELNKKSPDEIWQMLYEIDPGRAACIHKNNKDKVIRSIEMCRGLNMPISQYKREKKQTPLHAKWFMTKIDRKALYERINKRVDVMIALGLYDEWKKNCALYPNSTVIKNTIGYREFFEFDDFYLAVDKIKQRTRNFAKRQLTYFRSNNDITPVNCVDEILRAQ